MGAIENCANRSSQRKKEKTIKIQDSRIGTECVEKSETYRENKIGKKSERGKQEKRQKDGGQFRGFGRATKGKAKTAQAMARDRVQCRVGYENFCIICKISGFNLFV